jgi:putative oxidoreductase
MSFSETISPFFGRCAFVWFYGAAAMNILTDWHNIAVQMDAKHVPVPPLLMVVALVLIVLGCISLLFGYHTRHGAVLLFGLTVVAAVTLHDFWHIADGPARWADFQIFSRDIAICGGLLLMVGMGAGPFAIDNRTGGGKRR